MKEEQSNSTDEINNSEDDILSFFENILLRILFVNITILSFSIILCTSKPFTPLHSLIHNGIFNNSEDEKDDDEYEWDGPVLTKSKGVNDGPSGKETYYNLDMSNIVSLMRAMGYSEKDYPYNVRDDGVKCLGEYVMVAANLQLRPRGTIIQTSLGKAIVCDTGGFASSNSTQLDIATTW